MAVKQVVQIFLQLLYDFRLFASWQIFLRKKILQLVLNREDLWRQTSSTCGKNWQGCGDGMAKWSTRVS